VWLLRIGKRGRWCNEAPTTGALEKRSPGVAADIDEALRDFELRDGELGVSVLAVADEGDARELAMEWALEKRTKDDHVDYVLLRDAIVPKSIRIERHEDVGATHHRLRTDHHELRTADAGAFRELVVKMLETDDVWAVRLKRSDVVAERQRRAALAVAREGPTGSGTQE
jgi:hypothetical protein